MSPDEDKKPRSVEEEKFFHPGKFLGWENSSYQNAQIVILPVPYEVTTTYGTGTRRAPEAIIAASRELEFWDEELQQDISSTIKIYTFPAVAPIVSGPEDMISRVEQVYLSILKDKKFVVLIGGEHTLTLAAVKALQRKYSLFSFLQLDAHLDLRSEYQGSPYSHACVMRRVNELVPVVPMGIRSVSKEEHLFISEKQIRPFYAREIKEKKEWIEEVISHLQELVYISIDLDVFDPGIMPAVGTPEPGGLDWYEVMALLRTLTEKRKIIGFDVMEGCPIPDLKAPDFLGAKLIYKLLGFIFSRPHSNQIINFTDETS